ncbi:RNA polymerase II transcription factor B subunit 1 [Orbilia oligospora]|uniref:RNA polymerase II transcription factor B subunit 1 n=1 Tax=Orbilia oligospora TaxID=2813651 RepID=A0A7C8RA30_ORBOL|nr:RNA polymerase II transcription factor B subunit 1 [Orbilia oligospora]
MAVAVKASALYKKKNGEISLDADGKTLTWQAESTNAGLHINISVDLITSLQATPPKSAKSMIKVFVQHPTEGTVDPYVFTFSGSPEEASVFKTALTTAIQILKSTPASDPGPSFELKDDRVGPDSRPAKLLRNRTDHELQEDMSLQQAVLSASPTLQKKFHEAVISGGMTPVQFWSTRIHLLRAFAVEQAQVRGSYNVLATIKPKTEDSVVRVSLSRDQIHTIFKQHPIIQKVYDEVVPKLREDEFWRRFFLSKLYKKLKGEKLVPTDSHDDVLDQYLKVGSSDFGGGSERQLRIPHIIDIEGNEDNHSQKQGNRPDLTMRPNKTENVPIIRTLNNLSSKLLDSVNPVDSINEQGPRAQDNVDIKLHDLQNDSRQQKILLNVRDHRQFFNVEYQTYEVKAQETLNRDTTGVDILLKLFQNTASHKSLTRRPSDHNLVHEAQQWHPRSIERGISDDNNHALRGASTHISTILAIRRVQMPGSFGSISIPDSQIWDQLLLTHATSTEFLRHFWGAFFSGDPKKIGDVRNMASSLSRSLERIEFIAMSAEEKEKSNTETGRGDPDRKRSKGSHRPLNERGYVLVKKVITPQENAIKTALAKYQQALQSTCDSN